MNRQNREREMSDNELKSYLVGIGLLSLFVFVSLLIAKFLTPIQLLYTHICISCFGLIYFLTVYITNQGSFKHQGMVEQQEKLSQIGNEIIIRINGKELLRL
ncbi:hypothetical protein [Bacillus sp. FJAT-45066]|uniref:hypothetical protein n=1 Tax=Bacillus sp. FJAT-45066 TaxID=2011010 RepID=UPI000BB87DEC|nr:hypothetical protein [Bacillus sp. FJAT-45066]